MWVEQFISSLYQFTGINHAELSSGENAHAYYRFAVAGACEAQPIWLDADHVDRRKMRASTHTTNTGKPAHLFTYL